MIWILHDVGQSNVFFSSVALFLRNHVPFFQLQSYGGFCAVTYLSFAPEGLKSVLLTGGLPPLGEPCTAQTVYRACFKQVQQQNEKYYKRYPQDIQVIHEIVRYLSETEGGGVSKFLQ